MVILPVQREPAELSSLVRRMRDVTSGVEGPRAIVVVDDLSSPIPLVSEGSSGLPVRRLEHRFRTGLDRVVVTDLLPGTGAGHVVLTIGAVQDPDLALVPDMLARIDEGNDVVVTHDSALGCRAYRGSFLRKMVGVYGPTDFLTESGLACTVELLLKGSTLGARVAKLPATHRRRRARRHGGPRDPNRFEWAHRALSTAIAAGALAVTLPVFGLVGWLVRRGFDGSVLVRHTRIGVDRRRVSEERSNDRRGEDLGGAPFGLYRFRTASAGDRDPADEPLPMESPDLTPLGRVLRLTRVDELPQLLNVLRGEMNLVGPRPVPLPLVERLRETSIDYPLRHRVRPGLTGRAQVEQFAAESFDELGSRTRHDIQYVTSRSVLSDVRILLRTVPVVLLGKGAS